MYTILVNNKKREISAEAYQKLMALSSDREDGDCCAEYSTTGFGCTRHPEHKGPCVAHGIECVVEVFNKNFCVKSL